MPIRSVTSSVDIHFHIVPHSDISLFHHPACPGSHILQHVITSPSDTLGLFLVEGFLRHDEDYEHD